MLDLWMKIILQKDWKTKNFFTLMSHTKLYFYMVRVLLLHGIHFLGEKN